MIRAALCILALTALGACQAAPATPPPRLETVVKLVYPDVPADLEQPCAIPPIGQLAMVSDALLSLADYQLALRQCAARHQALVAAIKEPVGKP